MTTATTSRIGPELATGTWTIDPAHSEVSFTVRHLMVAKVRGTFTDFSGTLVVAGNPLESYVDASIAVGSIDTRDPQRDAHLRSVDFFDSDAYPTMTYRSTSVRPSGHDFVIDGQLTLHGVTRPVSLDLEFNGVAGDPWGGTRAGFSAEAEISRSDFGIDLAMPLDGGGVVVGDKIKVHLEIEASLQTA